MRKPNTSRRGDEAPSLHPSNCALGVAENCAALDGVRASLRGEPIARPTSPQNLQHWTKERPESLQAMH